MREQLKGSFYNYRSVDQVFGKSSKKCIKKWSTSFTKEGTSKQLKNMHYREKYNQMYYESTRNIKNNKYLTKQSIITILRTSLHNFKHRCWEKQSRISNHEEAIMNISKLLLLTIQPFYGKYKRLTFKDVFTQSVHNYKFSCYLKISVVLKSIEGQGT